MVDLRSRIWDGEVQESIVPTLDNIQTWIERGMESKERGRRARLTSQASVRKMQPTASRISGSSSDQTSQEAVFVRKSSRKRKKKILTSLLTQQNKKRRMKPKDKNTNKLVDLDIMVYLPGRSLAPRVITNRDD